MKPARYRILVLLVLAAGVPGCLPDDDRPGSAPPPAKLPAARAERDTPPAAPEFTWREMDGRLERAVDTVAFSPDGKLVAAGGQDTIFVWAADTGKLVTRMRLPNRQLFHRLAFTADGRSLVSDCREDPLVRTWDVKTGKQTHEWRQIDPAHANGQYWSPLHTLAPDGRLMAVEPREGNPAANPGVDLLDPATGKRVTRVALGSISTWSGLAFSADGRRLACNGENDGRLSVWDTATGKLVREVRPGTPVPPGSGRQRGGHVIFSRDGRFLVAREPSGEVLNSFEQYRAVIWGATDGKRYAHFNQYRVETRLSADGRYLLTGSESVHDLLTDRAVPVVNAVKNRTLSSTSPDGKTLAFLGEAKGPAPGYWYSVFLTPAPTLPPPPVPEAGELSPGELDLLYGGWVSVNVFAQDYAGRALAARPAQAVAHVAAKLKPVPDIQRKRIEDAIRRLDGDEPDARDLATAELRLVAFEFQPMLAAARAAAPPGEVRNRLISVMEGVEGAKAPGGPAAEVRRLASARDAGLPPGLPPPGQLSEDVRGVALLERVGGPEARALLDALAAGAAGARITEEAREVLKRLATAATK